MSKIIDPDLLNQGVEVTFDPTTTPKTIKLNIAGNLSTDGVTLQALYSFAKEEWKTDSNLIKYLFPLEAITPEMYDLKNGWDFKDDATRNLIRNAGWALKDASNVSQEEYFGFITLGSMGATDQVYYQQSTAGVATNVVLQGPVNQAVKMYGDATHGNYDYRSYFKCFVREQGKIYDMSQLSAIGQTTLTYQVYSFPLSSSTDLKVTHLDAALTASPYNGMSIEYFATNQSRTIGGTPYNFNIIIGGNGGTKEQIYEFVQYKLRQSGDASNKSWARTTTTATVTSVAHGLVTGAQVYVTVSSDTGAIILGNKTVTVTGADTFTFTCLNTGATSGTLTYTVGGKTSASLLKFVGDTLVTSNGVYIDAFASADTNAIEFYDVGGVKRTFPYVAAGVININANLANDANAIFKMFFTNDAAATTPTNKNFGTANAIIVKDNSGVDIGGLISGRTSIPFTFDYDGNVQRGAGSNGKDAPITVIAIGLSGSQYVVSTATITKSNANSVSLVAALERNYNNPV